MGADLGTGTDLLGAGVIPGRRCSPSGGAAPLLVASAASSAGSSSTPSPPQPRHGYEIIQVIAEKSRGSYKPSPGVIYPTLQMLDDVGHARTLVQDERKTYEITAAGKRELREHEDEVTDFYQGGEDAGWEQHADAVTDVMKRVGRVIRLFKHTMHRGGVRPVTIRKMKTILDEALAKIEDLLAVEEP